MSIKGVKMSEESREKMRLSALKRFADKSNHPRFGKKHTPEALQKLSDSHIGQVVSEETRKKLSEARKGEKHWNWQGGISGEKHRLRGTIEWSIWRKSVFERDNYTCQECFTTKTYLEPHHIIPIREGMDKLFNTNNGITLCRPCHQKTIWKESDFQEKYLKIVEA